MVLFVYMMHTIQYKNIKYCVHTEWLVDRNKKHTGKADIHKRAYKCASTTSKHMWWYQCNTIYSHGYYKVEVIKLLLLLILHYF